MLGNKLQKRTVLLGILLLTLFVSGSWLNVKAADNDNVKTVTVTVNQKNGNSDLQPGDFQISENGKNQQVLSVIPANDESVPLNLALVIQEDNPQINSELPALKNFIKGLPANSEVMVVYLNGNFVNAKPFTSNLEEAAKSLRVVAGSVNGPSSPYLSLIDVMKKFNGRQQGRNEILLISSGIDSLLGTTTPNTNSYLERAIKTAQKENITIYTIHSASARGRGRAIGSFGENGLSALSEQTGGYSFYMGSNGFVSFDAPLRDLTERLNNQYVIAYRSDNTDKQFRTLKVRTDSSEIKIEAPKGYKADF